MDEANMTDAPSPVGESQESIYEQLREEVNSKFREVNGRDTQILERLQAVEGALKRSGIPFGGQADSLDPGIMTYFGWVPNAFRWHNSDSCTHIHNQLIEAQGEVQDYKNICDELAAADQKNQQTREQTCMRIQELERQLQDSQNKQSTLQQEVQKLNGVIVNAKKHEDEPTDAELTGPYREIVASIHTICKKLVSGNFISCTDNTNAEVAEILGEVDPARNNKANLRFRLRAKFFNVLQGEIFKVPSFGLKDTGEEHAFVGFEQALMLNNTIELDSVADWRRRTLACARTRGEPFDSQGQVKHTAKKLLGFAQAFSLVDSELEDGLKVHITEMCSQAWKLALRMRLSSYDHSVRIIESGREIHGFEEEDLKVVASEDPNLLEKDVPGSYVSYTLSGALIRNDFVSGHPIVLEKAQVIVEKQDPT